MLSNLITNIAVLMNVIWLAPVGAEVISGSTLNLDGPDWVIATDPENVGRDQEWFKAPRPDAKAARVPGIIQETFPTYHGVAWYYRKFQAPRNSHKQGRYLLRFWQVDYLADVWLNGTHVGQHEGTGELFVLDVTETMMPQADNLIAVRVLNPKHETIDGISLGESTMWARGIPCSPGSALNYGGLIDTVELLIAPAVRVEDLYVMPDPGTGKIRIQANLCNAGKKTMSGKISFAVSSATQGESLNMVEINRRLPVGDMLIEAELTVENPRLWELNDPYMYRITAQVATDATNSVDEFSTRCGFRDFRFENGYFRLNSRRIFLKSSQTDARAPGGIFVPHDPDLVRRDLVNVKATNQNMIRSFGGQIPRYQLDLCDELGIMVYQEHAGAWRMHPSPKLAERFNRSVQAMVKRDRNRPSIVIWGVLNETPAGPVFDQGVAALPLIQAIDDTRMVILNSGGYVPPNTFANPGVHEWQSDLFDIHPYQSVPHRAAQVNAMRTLSSDEKPVFHSEGGVCSAIDLARLARHYEQIGKDHCEDAAVCRGFLDRFLADWDRWNMADTFANPEDYFHQCVAWMTDLRKVAVNAFRANPNLVGYNTTGTVDPSTTGEGMLASTFRQLKPGMVDAMFDAFAPLHWCLFVEPVQVYRGRTAKFEAVLANEDILKPGEYPVRLQVVGPSNENIFDRTITVNIPDPKGNPEPKFTLPVFAEDIIMNGPSGKYRFLATFQKAAAAAGGDIEFYVADPAKMPKVETEVRVWGDDPDLLTWLNANGIKARAFVPGEQQNKREVIVAGYRSVPNEDESFGELTKHIARGSHVIFLYPEIFQKDSNRTAWLPLLNKGDRIDLPLVWAHKDDWSKHHPIFDGLPAGGIFDHTFYREIFSGSAFSGQDVPAEVVAGATNTSVAYSSGLTMAVYNLGGGRFTINTLHIRQNLGNDPVAERLLRNMLLYAARDMDKPMAELPPGFYQSLYELGYSYCESGVDIPCPLQEGVCAGCVQTCTEENIWPGCDYSTIPDYEPSESNCTDGLDNDCDGLVDGEDPSCGDSPEGMISYWKLNETVAGPVIDCCGSNHGTNHGAGINQTGQIESAYGFKDNKNYVSFPYSDDWDFGSGDFTIEFWFNPATQRRMAVFAGDTDYWLGIDFHYQGTRNINIWASSTGTSWDLIRADDDGNGVGSISIPLNQWSHIVYTRDGNQWMTYINGVQNVNITVSGSIVNKTENKRIAKWGSPVAAFGFDGLIDEIAIYKRSLKPSEIQEHYENGVAGQGY
jgi:hypothetical protein